MLKLDPKDEAFAIKIEELMKQALSEELQEMLGDEGQLVDLATDDNDETITEEEMIRIVKKEPNEKPLSMQDFATNSLTVEQEPESEPLENAQYVEPDHCHNFRRPSQTQSQENAEDNDGDASEQQNPAATVPDMTMPEPERLAERVPNEPACMDLEAIYQETLVDTKPTSTTKGVDFSSVECKSCQITFNDNYGFRRHLNHLHPHDPDHIERNNEYTSYVESDSGRSLRSRSRPTASSSTSYALHKKNPKCNIKFKRQFRANLKLKHLKTIPLPETYEKPAVEIQCRFCQQGGWKESEYRVHLLQRHSRELNPLSKQIADSNSERLKETEVTTSSTAAKNTASTSNKLSVATNGSPATTDPDIIMLDIPYDPIKDISENQRRTYQFFQNYMLDIS
ncbi:uncharacterized protein ATC70_012693 [Mucor velutinosus]|uniref:C2H2-type domain-containing protein n=1 Tax=Mucor velutinosus TaxID=708070 RepID=A0AAN7HX46_9FUNG|nr:hypothetical protein ATC70_012693 [Mucor velutinosus]